MKKKKAVKINPETGEKEDFMYEMPETEKEVKEVARKREKGELYNEPADLAFSPDEEE